MSSFLCYDDIATHKLSFVAHFYDVVCNHDPQPVQMSDISDLTNPSQNPFYIHLNENPTTPSVNHPLNGMNYHSWL